MNKSSKKYDLEERTAVFGEKSIQLCKNLRSSSVSKPLIEQFIRSATSIGANYMEANGASSPRDFRNKIFICKKEAHESKHWLRMLMQCFPENEPEIISLLKEAQELTFIFQKITTTLNNKSKLEYTH